MAGREPLPDPVAGTCEAGVEPTGEHHQDDEEQRAGGQRHGAGDVGERGAHDGEQHLGDGDAGEDTADGTEPADDGHREDEDAGLHGEGGAADAAFEDGGEPAGDAGDAAGDHHGGDPDPGGGHGHGGRGAGVVPDRDGDPAGPGPAERVDDEDRERERGEAQVVGGALGAERVALPEHGPEDVAGDPAGVVDRVEEELVHGGGEGEAGDEHVHGVDPQRRRAEHEPDDPARSRGGAEGGEQVEVELDEEIAGDDRADADDGVLPEADRARPAREHDERQRDHAEEQVAGVAVGLARAHDQRGEGGGAGDDREEQPAGDGELGEPSPPPAATAVVIPRVTRRGPRRRLGPAGGAGGRGRRG